MNTRLFLLLAALTSLAWAVQASAQNTAFTYQGRLAFNGQPANGSYDLRFIPFNAIDGGSQTGPILTNSATEVTGGLFTTLLDFGGANFLRNNAWLEIAVRTNGGGAFNILSPRQPVTAAPYALTALNVSGIDGHSLHAASGGPTNAVFVDGSGNVGIGTTSPQEKFDLRSGNGSYVRVDAENGDIKVNGGVDGHWGIFNDGPATGGTHLVGQGQSRFFVANNGNVGVGTVAPQTKLHVQGDVRLGPSGQFHAASSSENLHIVRGAFNADGTVIAGSGFTVIPREFGHYIIMFNPGFSDAPTVTATTGMAELITSVYVRIVALTSISCELVATPDRNGPFSNRPVHFIAVGPR